MQLPILDPPPEDSPPAGTHVVKAGLARFPLWTWAHRLTAAGFLTVLVASQRGWFDGFRGSITAGQWFGLVPFVDPLAACEVALAACKLTPTMLVGVSLTILMAVFLGRVFCGWLCPLGLVLEMAGTLTARISPPTRSQGNRAGPPRRFVQLKYWILLACLVSSCLAGVPVFTALSPINLTVLGFAGFPAIAFSVLIPLLALDFVWPRVFCRTLCPLGATYSLLGHWAPLRVRVVGTERLRCRQCSLHCPMGIDVMQDHILAGHSYVDDPECTRCGVCTDVCLGRILQIRFRYAQERTQD